MSVKRVVIDGHTYVIGRLLHTPSLEVFTLVLRNLGPAVGEAVQAAIKGGSVKSIAELNLDPRAIGRAIQDVCLRLSAADAGRVGEAFAGVTQVLLPGGKGKLDLTKADVYENHFAGRTGA